VGILALTGAAWAAGPELRVDHFSRADIENVDGQWKTVYDDAKFERIRVRITDFDISSEDVKGEETGIFTIISGDYTVLNGALEEIGKVYKNNDTSFDLAYGILSASEIISDCVRFYPQQEKQNVFFGGEGVENNLDGKTIEWTHPVYGETKHTSVIPKFHSTDEFLSDFAPYIEYVTSDGEVTGIKWKFVTSDDKVVATAPLKGSLIYLEIHYKTDLQFPVLTQPFPRPEFDADSIPEGGTIVFDSPISIDAVSMVIFAFTLHEDEAAEDSFYFWRFSPRTASNDDVVDSIITIDETPTVTLTNDDVEVGKDSKTLTSVSDLPDAMNKNVIVQDGVVVANETAVLSGLTAADKEQIDDKKDVVPLPVFKTAVSKSGNTAIVTFKAQLLDFVGSPIEDLVILKLKSNDVTALLGSAPSLAEITNGQYIWTESSGDAIPPSTKIANDRSYYFNVAIKDNGDYDWTGDDRTVIDPLTMAVKKTSPSEDLPKSSSGGGCDTGFGAIGLLLMGMVLRKYWTL
jgi:hypothetical protein